jgi:hypothetical protein
MRSARWPPPPAGDAWSQVTAAEPELEPEPEPSEEPELDRAAPVRVPDPVRDDDSRAQVPVAQPVDTLLQNSGGERDFERRALRLRFVDATVELSYLGSSARQAGWFGFAAYGVTLAACSAAMAVGSHQLYAGASVAVLPLHLILLASQIGLVGALCMVAVRRMRLAGNRAGCCSSGHCEAVWALAPLLLGGSVVAAEALWAPGPGYLHGQMWLLPLLAHSGAGACTGLCFEQAALGVWIPLIVYTVRTAQLCSSQEVEEGTTLTPGCYVPGTYIDGASTSGAQIAAYFAAYLVFAASASVAAWRAERSHRDAFVASLQTELELEEVKREDGRIAQLVSQGFAGPIVRTMQEVAGLSPAVVRQPGVTSLHLLQSGSVFVVDIILSASYINASPSALDMCGLLNATFAVVDKAVNAYGCEKVGTVGCRYLAIAGLYSTSTGEHEPGPCLFNMPANIWSASRRPRRTSSRMWFGCPAGGVALLWAATACKGRWRQDWDPQWRCSVRSTRSRSSPRSSRRIRRNS